MPEISSHWHNPDRRKRCILCGDTKSLSEFYSYQYVTKQGKASRRYESRCRPCAMMKRRGDHAANPLKGQAASRRWREQRPGYTAWRAREYRATEQGRVMKAKSQRLRKARLRSGQGDDEAIRAIYAEAMRIEQVIALCPVFDLPELGKKMHVDHRTPLSKGGRHEASNLQVLAAGLNMRKGTRCLR